MTDRRQAKSVIGKYLSKITFFYFTTERRKTKMVIPKKDEVRDSTGEVINDEDLVFEITVRPYESNSSQKSTLIVTQMTIADVIEKHGLKHCIHTVPVAFGKEYKEGLK